MRRKPAIELPPWGAVLNVSIGLHHECGITGWRMSVQIEASAKRGNNTREIRAARSGAGLSDLRPEGSLIFGLCAGRIWLQVVPCEVVAQEGEGFVRRVGNLEELAISGR